MEPEDVTPDSSAGTPEPEPVLTAPEPVTSATQGDDRPVQNVVGEMNRRFGKMQSQMDLMMQMVAAQQAPQATAKPASREELWALAQQGDQAAFELYMEQIADKRTNARLNEMQHTQAVTGQIGVLVQRYPAFNDPSHPLNQAYQSNYNLLVQNGYPANRATQLDAMKTAIADPGVSGQDGSSQRRAPTPAISCDQQDLAKRMNVKDPAKAIERFRQRQDSGVSNLGAVANSIPEDSL